MHLFDTEMVAIYVKRDAEPDMMMFYSSFHPNVLM